MDAAKEIAWETLGPAPAEIASPERAGEILRASWAERASELRGVLAADTVVLVVNDPARSTRTRESLEALASIAPSLPRFRVLVATGTHRLSPGERAAFESSTFADLPLSIESITWHDAEHEAALRPLGGAKIHELVASARSLLAIGSVEPHYFAGATGAHKTLTIGCLARRDIEKNHAGALDPASDVLRLDGNPVHDGIARLVASLREGRSIVAQNQILSGETVVAARTGDPLETLHALLPEAHRVFAHTLDEPADVLHLRVPFPLGKSFYQADKALKNNHLAVAGGGAIVLEAECPDGVGQDAFVRLLRSAATYAEACAAVERDGYRLGDHKAVKLRHLTDPAARGVHVALIAKNVSLESCRLLGVEPAASLDEALARLSSRVRLPLARGVRVEDAGMVCVRAR